MLLRHKAEVVQELAVAHPALVIMDAEHPLHDEAVFLGELIEHGL